MCKYYDEPAIADIYGAMLRRLGYTVEVKTDPLAVLETFRKKPDGFDLLITDLKMPGMNGMEVLRRVREARPDIKVIIITAYGEIGAVIEALRAGADDFLLKPCDIEEMLLRIEKTFERQDLFKKIKICEKIFSATKDLIALVDENGTYLAANRAYLDAYDTSGEELLGCSVGDEVRFRGGTAEVVRLLDGHPAVARVYYPGLASHPGHALAARPTS